MNCDYVRMIHLTAQNGSLHQRDGRTEGTGPADADIAQMEAAGVHILDECKNRSLVKFSFGVLPKLSGFTLLTSLNEDDRDKVLSL